ncbi:hypothetical protein D7Y13_25385 [Corallococcus praedator]|uniref:Uncharacterized protein n=1 Tax=Corallococcus praedator TaxID=2316724 RepID=A0ABX9QCD3_9BACT|nr:MULTISPECIES: hypothetical protein [Corallococcus]RKH20954.1 hypothetical protein D7X74_02665 [Corallococcus sp. CA047B]RKH25022.1 hypothetical protein D7X75_30805 [Corallococcus sp. CA031C]RKI02132.1 hypothetical protein D7Y13_25385 [Corallococcus praedator]
MSGLLTSSSSLKEFFRELLLEVTTRQRVALNESTEFYLVNLLAEFAASDKLFSRDAEGRREHEPLAELYHRALQQERDERIRTLRRLGDVSLYKVGFFSGALQQGMVGPDYYIQMGGAAYGQVAELVPAGGFTGVYRELCDKFRSLVEVLEEISARGLVSAGPAGALRVYESWVRTGSDRLERVLVDAGWVPRKGPLAN